MPTLKRLSLVLKWHFLNVWEFMQNYVGRREVLKYNLSPSHFFKDCYIYYITYDDSHSLGKYIFLNRNAEDRIIFRHEYGHRIQSKMLGALYMLLVAIPSYLHFTYWVKYKNDNWDEYYDFYCENWANSLVKKVIK